MGFRKRVYEIVEVAASGDRASRIFDISILSLIALNVLALILETVTPIYKAAPQFFIWFEIVSVAIFTLEYILRIWSCVDTVLALDREFSCLYVSLSHTLSLRYGVA